MLNQSHRESNILDYHPVSRANVTLLLFLFVFISLRQSVLF